MRRAANPSRKISITLKNSTFNRLEQYLSYDQSVSYTHLTLPTILRV